MVIRTLFSSGNWIQSRIIAATHQAKFAEQHMNNVYIKDHNYKRTPQACYFLAQKFYMNLEYIIMYFFLVCANEIAAYSVVKLLFQIQVTETHKYICLPLKKCYISLQIDFFFSKKKSVKQSSFSYREIVLVHQ